MRSSDSHTFMQTGQKVEYMPTCATNNKTIIKIIPIHGQHDVGVTVNSVQVREGDTDAPEHTWNE